MSTRNAMGGLRQHFEGPATVFDAFDSQLVVDRPMSRRAGIAAAWITIALFACAAASAVRYGLADVFSIKGNEKLTAWQTSGTPLTLETALSVQTMIDESIKFDEGRGDNFETLGTLHFAYAEQRGLTYDQRVAQYRAAAVRFRDALDRMRTSPYAWASVLLAKSKAGDIDEEFNAALVNSAYYGPYDPAVQGLIVEAALPHWNILTPAQREVLSSNILRAWPTNRDGVRREAMQVRGERTWCKAKEAGLKQLCEGLPEEKRARNTTSSPSR